MPTTYQVPILLEEQGLLDLLRTALLLDEIKPTPALVARGAEIWKKWKAIIPQTYADTVDIALVGKYAFHDAYLSVVKALEHSAMRCGRKLNLIWVDSEDLEDATQQTNPTKFHKAWHEVCSAAGIIVPGGTSSPRACFSGLALANAENLGQVSVNAGPRVWSRLLSGLTSTRLRT